MIDEQLISSYINGKDESLKDLFGCYLKPIYNFVYSYVSNNGDAEDITQEVFVSVWRNIKKFDQEKKFKTWIFVIAQNASINWLKKKKPYLFSVDDSIVESIVDLSLSLEEIIDQKNYLGKVFIAMNSLNQNYQTVLRLKNLNQFNFREIAEFLGDSINTVKSRHRRALASLKKILDT